MSGFEAALLAAVISALAGLAFWLEYPMRLKIVTKCPEGWRHDARVTYEDDGYIYSKCQRCGQEFCDDFYMSQRP